MPMDQSTTSTNTAGDLSNVSSSPKFNLAARGDGRYNSAMRIGQALLAIFIIVFFGSIIIQSIPGWQSAGFGFFTSTDWSNADFKFGALSLIAGTLVTTFIALLFAVPVGISAALSIQFLLHRRLRVFFSSLVEVLAIVPSIVFGVWGVAVISPWTQHTLEPFLRDISGGTPPFQGEIYGIGLLLGGLVLGVMILPTVVAVSRDAFAMVPQTLIEGAYGLGATRTQVLFRVALPAARRGVLGAVTLGTGRALGETVAMATILGGVTNKFPSSAFDLGATLASTIARDFLEATGSQVGALGSLALILTVIVFTMNYIARKIITRQAVTL
jgi:phosphate transport system permease protein